MYRILYVAIGFALASNAAAVEYGCAGTSQSLFDACGFDLREGYLEGLAICIDSNDAAQAAECMAGVEEELEENAEECADVLEARIEVCEKLDNAAHEPDFGEEFAANFVDPLEIGVSVEPNPWYPLVQGNQWTYEASGIDDEGEEVSEIVVVTVTNKVKLISGIPCLVVNDTVSEDDELVEDTDDWFAQDLDGNIWYCGEISRDFEFFDGDEPEVAELVEIEGSFKDGRDGAEAGMLLPFSPVPGTTLRQEVLYGDAEDVIDIDSLEGTESAPAASCAGDCLVTTDYTALEPSGLENKYYVPGIGLIVETKPGTTERLELIEFTVN